MTPGKFGGAASIPVGMVLMVIGLLVGRTANTSAFGLSSDFWAGFLMGTGIGVLLLGIWLGLQSRSALK
jgi:hypothetical protein